METRWARAGVVGAMAIGAVVAVTSFGAPGGAQTDATTKISQPGFDQAPAVSDDGRFIVFASSPDADGTESSIFLHDRGMPADDGTTGPATTKPVAGSEGGVNPSISGNGCTVTWSVPAESDESEPEIVTTEPVTTEPVTTEAVTTEAVTTEAVTTEAVTTEAVTTEAVTTEAVTTELQASEPSDSDSPNETEPVSASPPNPDAGGSSEAASLVAPLQVKRSALQVVEPRLVALDRCTGTGPIDLPLRDGDNAFGPAAASLDGSVIAVSNGDDVIRFERSGNAYAETNRFDGTSPVTPERTTSQRVDVSDDGSVIVFASGPGEPDADPASRTVFAFEGGSVSEVAASADGASVSGDGLIVAASSQGQIVVADRSVAPNAVVNLGPGRRPSISADGNHVVYDDGATLSVVSRTGQGEAPFATTQTTRLGEAVSPTKSDPVIDRLGTTVVSDRDFTTEASASGKDIAITTLTADASFDSELFDLGKGDVGAVLSTAVTFSNRGPSSVGVSSIAVDGTFTITDDRCGSVIRPGTTCEIDVSFTVERLEDAFATITLTPLSFGVDPYTAEVGALGEAPPVSTPTSTTTTTPSGSTTTGGTTGSTTGGTTRGSTTRGSTTRGSTTRGSTTGGSTTRGSTSRGTSTTGSTTTGGSNTSDTTTTTVAPGAGVSASPASFDFAPTIVDAGRRTGLVEVVNNGTGPLSVDEVRLDPEAAGAFEIAETTCEDGSVAVGARCGITLAYAPTETGTQNVSLIASFDGGTDVTVPVTGIGAPAPVIEVVPDVANVGQVVTVSGSGFPTSITVEVSYATVTDEVAVDDGGTFDLPVLVMPNSPTGPATISVAGQDDLFGDVSGEMIVTETSDRSGPPVLEGIGPNIGR